MLPIVTRRLAMSNLLRRCIATNWNTFSITVNDLLQYERKSLFCRYVCRRVNVHNIVHTHVHVWMGTHTHTHTHTHTQYVTDVPYNGKTASVYLSGFVEGTKTNNYTLMVNKSTGVSLRAFCSVCGVFS